MYQKGFAYIVIIVLVVVLIAASGYFVFVEKPADQADQSLVGNSPSPGNETNEIPDTSLGIKDDVNSLQQYIDISTAERYFLESGKVFYHTTRIEKTAITANADSFEVLKDVKDVPYECSLNPIARDDTHVFYGHRILFGADPDSYRLIGYPYTLDKNSVYYGKERIEETDPASFVVFEDKENFTDTCAGSFYQFARDNQNIYCHGRILADVDVASFDIIGDFQKDKDGVYFIGDGEWSTNQTCSLYSISNLSSGLGRSLKALPLDPMTFEHISGNYYRDKNDIYAIITTPAGTFIEVFGADSKTFSVIDPINNNDNIDAKDKNHSYKNGVIVP